MEKKVVNRDLIKKMVLISMFSVLAFVLQLFDFPISALFPGFLKLDFSDIPALFSSFMFGPVSGIIVELIKNVLHLFVTSTGGIGELANFIVGAAFVGTTGLIYKFKKDLKSAIIGMVSGTVVMGIIAGFTNYFILIPVYEKLFMPRETIIAICVKILPFVDNLFDVVFFSIVPFNLFKGVIISIITFLLYDRILPLFKIKQ